MKKLYFLLILIGCILSILSLKIYETLVFKENLPVLAYHDIVDTPIEETDCSLKDFTLQMKYVKDKKYQTLSLEEFYDWKKGKNNSGKKVVLTFDDGKESFYTTVVPILEKYNLKATIFVIESAIGEKGYLTREQINDLKENHKNITIASHSYHLHDEASAGANDYQLYVQDMQLNKKNAYKFYAYPFGIKNNAYEQALKDNQYKLAFLFSPSKWANREQNDLEITRVPIYKSNSFFKFKCKLFFKI